MKLAIIGSRNYNNFIEFTDKIHEFIKIYGYPETIISGGAEGTDTMAKILADKCDIPIIEIIPEWNKYGKYAGIKRNSDIIDISTHVIAFPSHKGKGTQDGIQKSKQSNKILVVHYID